MKVTSTSSGKSLGVVWSDPSRKKSNPYTFLKWQSCDGKVSGGGDDDRCKKEQKFSKSRRRGVKNLARARPCVPCGLAQPSCFIPKKFKAVCIVLVMPIKKNSIKYTRSSCGTLALLIKMQLAKLQAHQAHRLGLVMPTKLHCCECGFLLMKKQCIAGGNGSYPSRHKWQSYKLIKWRSHECGLVLPNMLQSYGCHLVPPIKRHNCRGQRGYAFGRWEAPPPVSKLPFGAT